MADGIAVGLPGEVPFAIVRELVDEHRDGHRGEPVAGPALPARAGQAGRRAGRGGRGGRTCSTPAGPPTPGPWWPCSAAATSTRCCCCGSSGTGWPRPGATCSSGCACRTRPGSLARLLAELAEADANVLEVEHVRTGATLQRRRGGDRGAAGDQGGPSTATTVLATLRGQGLRPRLRLSRTAGRVRKSLAGCRWRRVTVTRVTDAVIAEGLVKHYGDVKALDGVDLRVPQGTVLGLLGPNGAGKTTAVRILTTLLRPDAGRAEVAGIDVLADPAGVRSRIGLSGQYAAVDEYLTGFENLDMVGRLYHLGRRREPRAGPRAARPLPPRRGGRPARPRPTPAACAAASTSPAPWSPTRRCCSSTSRPPASTRAAAPTCGRSSSGLVAGGTTLLLTTQYLEEADRLADRDRRHRPRQGHRPGHRRRAQGAGRRRAARGHRRARRPACRPRRRAARAARGRPAAVDEHRRSLLMPVTGGTAVADRGAAPARRARRRRSTTSACAGPPSTTSSSPSPATPPSRHAEDGGTGEVGQDGPAGRSRR